MNYDFESLKEKIKDSHTHKEEPSEEEKLKQEAKNKLPDTPEYKHKYEFDYLNLYYGEDLVYNNITIHQPKMGQIRRFGENGEFGERDFYNSLNVFVLNPTSYRAVLWDSGVDWNKISEYELFLMLYRTLNPLVIKVLFGDTLDFTKMQFFAQKDETDEAKEHVVLYDPEHDTMFNEETHSYIVEYLRTMFNIYPKVEKAKGKATKEAIIWEDKMNAEVNAKRNTGCSSMLLPLISSCVNHPGFKYSKEQVDQMGIFEFMDSVQRLQIYESSTALMKGMYSGFCDTSKIKPDAYNFMKNIYHN